VHLLNVLLLGLEVRVQDGGGSLLELGELTLSDWTSELKILLVLCQFSLVEEGFILLL